MWTRLQFLGSAFRPPATVLNSNILVEFAISRYS